MIETYRPEETLPASFEPDTILPVQFYGPRKNRYFLQGEGRLMLAVLEDAVLCYLKNMDAKTRVRKLLYLEVREWMNSKRAKGLFSYEVLCTELDIDADALRSALETRRRLRQTGPLYVGKHRRRNRGAEPGASDNDRASSEIISAAAIKRFLNKD